jgi:hypothetical protein
LVIENLLIGVEGAKTPPKMLTHFHRAWAGSRELFKVLRAQRQPLEKFAHEKAVSWAFS